jgi:hypothetical protein
MEDRASTRPLATNKDSGAVTEDEDESDDDDEETLDEGNTNPKSSTTPKSVASPNKKTRRTQKIDDKPPPEFVEMKQAGMEQARAFQTMTLDYRRQKWTCSVTICCCDRTKLASKSERV